jgi:uncharacterized delta-60 repeat protein
VKGLRVLKAAFFAAMVAIALPASAAAAPGDFDATFGGGDGKVITNVTDGYDWANGVVIQEDDKIVTAGEASGGGGRFYVVRYLTDGTLDLNFGNDGVVFTNFTAGADFGYDVAVNSTGKIVVVGSAAGGGRRFALARYNADGSLDTSFGGDGKVLTNTRPGWTSRTASSCRPTKRSSSSVVRGAAAAVSRWRGTTTMAPSTTRSAVVMAR